MSRCVWVITRFEGTRSGFYTGPCLSRSKGGKRAHEKITEPLLLPEIYTKEELLIPDFVAVRRRNLSTTQLMAEYRKYEEAADRQTAIMTAQTDVEVLKEVMPRFPNLQQITMSAGHLGMCKIPYLSQGPEAPNPPYIHFIFYYTC